MITKSQNHTCPYASNASRRVPRQDVSTPSPPPGHPPIISPSAWSSASSSSSVSSPSAKCRVPREVGGGNRHPVPRDLCPVLGAWCMVSGALKANRPKAHQKR